MSKIVYQSPERDNTLKRYVVEYQYRGTSFPDRWERSLEPSDHSFDTLEDAKKNAKKWLGAFDLYRARIIDTQAEQEPTPEGTEAPLPAEPVPAPRSFLQKFLAGWRVNSD